MADSPLTYKIQRGIHIPLYRLTGGRIGHRLGKLTMLLLTVTGAKTGRRRTTPLIYGNDGENFVVIASRGGTATHPLWYKNLHQNSECEVQVRGRRVRCRARDATAQERPRLWQKMADRYPGYNGYQKATDRQTPVVVLEPRSG